MGIKIAIVQTLDVTRSDDYGDGSWSETVAASITDWSEVTPEEYELLRRAASQYHGYRDRRFHLVIRPANEPEFITNTIASYLEFAKKAEARLAAEEAQRKDAALARKIKREAKSKAEKKELLEKLKRELGEA